MRELFAASLMASQVMTRLLAAIASISLLVGGIGIMNILLVSVTERTREIGVRLAVGAKARHILLQFLVEAIVLSTAGGMLGTLLGIGAAVLIGRLAAWPILVSPPAVAIALVFSGVVGLAFGVYPPGGRPGSTPSSPCVTSERGRAWKRSPCNGERRPYR